MTLSLAWLSVSRTITDNDTANEIKDANCHKIPSETHNRNNNNTDIYTETFFSTVDTHNTLVVSMQWHKLYTHCCFNDTQETDASTDTLTQLLQL